MTIEEFDTQRSNPAIVALQQEILTRIKLHSEMVRRLVNDQTVQPVELAGFLEDVANAYLSISEELIQMESAEERK